MPLRRLTFPKPSKFSQADFFEVKDTAGVVGLDGDGSAVGVDQAFGPVGRSLGGAWFGVVDHLLVVDMYLDAFALDADSNCEPLRFIDRGFGNLGYRIKTARFVLFFRGTIELNFVTLVQILAAAELAIGMKEEPGVRAWFAPGDGDQLKVLERNIVLGVAHVKQVGHAAFAVGFQDAVGDGERFGMGVGLPAF